MGYYWTDAEDSVVNQHYALSPKQTMIDLLPDRSWEAIKIRANKLNITRTRSYANSGDATSLIEDTPIAFYWIGFLLADGYFGVHGSINLKIAKLDQDHLHAFAVLLKAKIYTYKSGQVGVTVKHKDITNAIIKKFDIQHRKTYNPPRVDLYNFADDLWISLICGYIDGDGCISQSSQRRTRTIKFTVHSTWLVFLQKIVDKLEKVFGIRSGKAKINGRGYAILEICKQELIALLKKKALTLNLPLLNRKWGKIDESIKHKFEKARILEETVGNLLDNGISLADICQYKTEYTKTAIYKAAFRFMKKRKIMSVEG